LEGNFSDFFLAGAKKSGTKPREAILSLFSEVFAHLVEFA
jgi:hypothetical protein